MLLRLILTKKSIFKEYKGEEMDLEEVKKYIDLFEKSKLCKFSIKKKDTELFLEKDMKLQIKILEEMMVEIGL